jgi:hypothetical protein
MLETLPPTLLGSKGIRDLVTCLDILFPRYKVILDRGYNREGELDTLYTITIKLYKEDKVEADSSNFNKSGTLTGVTRAYWSHTLVGKFFEDLARDMHQAKTRWLDTKY